MKLNKNKDNNKFKNTIKDIKDNNTDTFEYTNKDVFYNSLKIVNHQLDMVRNAIFNLIMTNSYTNIIEFEFKDEFVAIDKSIGTIDGELSKLLKKLNIKFNERKEQH